jgi:hypothetical protein
MPHEELRWTRAGESGAPLSRSAEREGEGAGTAVDGVGVVGGPRVGSGCSCVLDDDGKDGALRRHGGALRCHEGARAAGGATGTTRRRVSARHCHHQSRWSHSTTLSLLRRLNGDAEQGNGRGGPRPQRRTHRALEALHADGGRCNAIA